MTDYERSYVPRNQKTATRGGTTPEAKVSAAVNRYLDTIPCLVLRTGAGMAEIGGRKIRIGMAGCSDKTVLLPGGRWCAVEEKATTDLSPDQKAYQARVEALGGIFIVARSAADVRSGLIAACGESTVLAWEQAGRDRVAAKQAEIKALKNKNRKD